MEEQSALAQPRQPEESAPPKAAPRKSKRPRGTGSIYRMGRYWYVAYYVQATGKQVTESSRSPLKSVAEHMLRDRLEKVRQGLYCGPAPTKITFEDLAQDVLNDYRINRLRTLRDAKCRIDLHLRPFFGNFLAVSITTEKIREFLLLRRGQGAADSTAMLELALLKRMFNLAYRAQKIARVPYIPLPRVTDNVRKGFIDQAAYETLLVALPDYLKPIVMTAYLTGMRRGEILGLRWENVDLLNRQIRLNPGETKNGEGRTIPLGNELLEALKSHLHVRNSNFPECPLVFFRTIKSKENPAPRWVPVGDFRKSWDDACEKSGLKGRIFHDLRRSAVRNLVRAGVQESVAMRISGHRTRSVFDRYNITSETDLREAVRKLEKFQELPPPIPASAPSYQKPVASPVRSGFVN